MINFSTQVLSTFFDLLFLNLLFLGTGIVKGPFNHYKRIHKWEDGEGGTRCTIPTKRLSRVLNMYLMGFSS